MMNDRMPIREFELNIRAMNIITRWKEGATLGDVREAFEQGDAGLLKNLRVRDRKEIIEILALPISSAVRAGIFDHITADLVRNERERSGNGMMEVKLQFQRAALLDHIKNASDLDLRFVLTWLVERS